MADVPQFAHFGKSFNELWSAKYCFDNAVSITTMCPGNWTFMTIGKLYKDGFAGIAKAAFSSKDWVGDCEADTGSGKLWGRFFAFNKPVPKAIFTLSGGLDPSSFDPLVKHGLSVKCDTEYATSSYAVGASVLLAENRQAIDGRLEASLAVGSEGSNIGGQIIAPLNALHDFALNFGSQYDHKDFSVTLLTEKAVEQIKLSWFHKQPSRSFGFEVVSDESRGAERSRVFNFASEHQLDVDTQMKFRINNYGEVGAVVEHRLGPALSVAAAAQFIHRGYSSLRADKLGISLFFSPR